MHTNRLRPVPTKNKSSKRVGPRPRPLNVKVMLLFLFGFMSYGTDASAANCLYISSYHQGYEWNDGIEEGIESTLNNHCKLDRFYMDTKRFPDKAFIKKMALAAKKHIETTKPDVVIACDDNASKYLIKPYFKHHEIPFAFCGINWTVDEYGYPYENVTGMIEVAPIRPLLKVVRKLVEKTNKGVYLSADVLTEHKDYQRYKTKYAEAHVNLKGVFVKTSEAWKREFINAQSADFIILNNNSGINDWNNNDIREFVIHNNKTLSITNYEWMIPYSMLAMTKIPQEQGEWAAKIAIAILQGEKAGNLPIVVNRRWNIFINDTLVKNSTYTLPPSIMTKAVRREK